MKAITKLLTMIVMITVTSFCNAQTFASETEVATVATKYMQFHFNERAYSNINIDSIRQYKKSDQILLYEVNYKNGNSVLISGIKNVMPILGYSTSGDGTSFFDVDDEIGLFYFIDKYATSIENIINRQNDTINELWNIILNDSINFYQQNNRSIYGPLLTSEWGQDEANSGDDLHAYNYYVTETDSDCYSYEYCPAGCVAVAMGQIMNYWKYPVYVPAKTEQYDWCNMPDKLEADSANYEQERNAVARLLRDCGKYSNTKYCFFGGCQSFAFPEDAKDAFVNNFGYNGANLVKRYLNLSKWDDMMKSEIMMGRPVFYAAFEENVFNGAHAFVCDGYNSNTAMYHFNWGWYSNVPNVWVSINDIDSEYGNWNILERAIINLHPSGSQNYCNFVLDLSYHYDNYYNVLEYTSPQPYENIPQTATVLKSAPNSNPASWRTIPAGATSKYVAHEEIILQDGFVAEEGSNFHAHIEPCLSCDDDVAMTSTGHNDRRYTNDDNHGNIILVGDNQKISTLSQSNESLHGITIYPNPTDGMFNVSFNNPDECLKHITIVNHLGSVVVNRENPDDNTIDMNNLSSGLYIVKIISDKGNVYFDKIIKN